MGSNENKELMLLDEEMGSFDELELQLEQSLASEMQGLEALEKDREKISNPANLAEVVGNTVWEQFINQIGQVAGEDFIRENGNLTLDLSDDAHIQTTENFAKGDIATHNKSIDYQKRYDEWQKKFERDDNGNIKTHVTRTGRVDNNVLKEARKPFDENRPTGSVEKGTDYDHTVSAAEIIRDPEANAHLSLEEQVKFANSSENLNEIRSELNRSKGDLPTKEWLDNPNSKGQKPDEIFNISPEEDGALRGKDDIARKKYTEVKKEGEKKSIETGKQSQRDEAIRIGKDSLTAVILGLLAAFLKDIMKKFVQWIIAGKKKLAVLIDYIKDGIHDFVANLKSHLKDAGDIFVTSISSAIIGPFVRTIKKAWMVLKQAGKSLWNAIKYIRDPANAQKPISILLMEAGKIIVAGLTAVGSIIVSEVIATGLENLFPFFRMPIPLLGTVGSIVGIFLGGLISGLIGALAINLMDKVISKKLKENNRSLQICQRNEVIETQTKLITIKKCNLVKKEVDAERKIYDRHVNAKEIMKESVGNIMKNRDIIMKNSDICLDEGNNQEVDDMVLSRIMCKLHL